MKIAGNVAKALSGVVVALCARGDVWGGNVTVRMFGGALGYCGFLWGAMSIRR